MAGAENWRLAHANCGRFRLPLGLLVSCCLAVCELDEFFWLNKQIKGKRFVFYFFWAVKNIFRNKRRAIENILFIACISMMFILDFSFLDGSQRQMEKASRDFSGDIGLNARSSDLNLAEVQRHLSVSPNKNAIEIIISEYSFGNVRVISDEAYLSQSFVKGFSPNNFEQLNKSVEWIAGGAFFTDLNQAVIERSMARELAVSVDDIVTLEFRTPQGAINTTTCKISGVFIGNKYFHLNTLFVSQADAVNLGLVDSSYANHLKIFLRNPDDEVTLRKIVEDDLNPLSHLFYTHVNKWSSNDVFFEEIFQLSSMFFKILITMFSIVLLIVLFLGVQNSFYLSFVARSNEISVLTTFGMPFVKMYLTIFWETILLFSAGLTSGSALAFLIGSLLTGVSLAQLSEEIVVVLGGPKLQFDFLLQSFLWVGLFMFGSGLYASFFSLRKYFKLEVREMTRGI